MVQIWYDLCHFMKYFRDAAKRYLNGENFPNWSLGLTQLKEEENQAKEKLKTDAREKRKINNVITIYRIF